MCKICLYFDLDIPYILNRYRHFDIGNNSSYFNEGETKNFLKNKSQKSLDPLFSKLDELIKKHGDKFKFTFSISGLGLDLIGKYDPELMKKLKVLSKTGNVEFILRPYNNSFIHSKQEFESQLNKYKETMKKYFGIEPKVSLEPEFDDISNKLDNFSDKDYYLTAESFNNAIFQKFTTEDIVNLKLNSDIFGIQHDFESGIFEFLEHLPAELLKDHTFHSVEELSSHSDKYKDFYFKSQDIENDIQQEVFNEMKNFESLVLSSENTDLIESWRKLNDYLNFSSLKHSFKGSVYDNSYDTYVYFMNILSDMKSKV